MEYRHGRAWQDLFRRRQQDLCIQATISNAYAYTDCNCDSYLKTHIYSYFHCNSNSYCHGDRDFYSNANDYTSAIPYANRNASTESHAHTHVHPNRNCHSYTDTDSDRDFYTDTNPSTDARCSNGPKANPCDWQQLYRKMEPRKRCDRLPVGRVHEQFLCYLRTRVPKLGRRQYD